MNMKTPTRDYESTDRLSSVFLTKFSKQLDVCFMYNKMQASFIFKAKKVKMRCEIGRREKQVSVGLTPWFSNSAQEHLRPQQIHRTLKSGGRHRDI